MKLLIDIPDNDYRFIKDIYQISGGRMVAKGTQKNVINAIKSGTPCDTLIEELKSRMDYGIEYAQAMSDVIAILERSEQE